MINHIFDVKSDNLEWRNLGKIPVYYFAEGEVVTVEKIDRLAIETKTGDGGTEYTFVIFNDQLGDGVTRRLWELKKNDKLIIIPVHVTEIRRISWEPSTSQSDLAYAKLVELKREWSILTDPYASINSLADPQWFFGKSQKAVIQSVLQEMAEGASNFVVFGMRRVGKTTLLNEIARNCQEKDYAVVHILCKPFLPGENSYEQVLGRIIEGWQNALEVLHPNYKALFGSSVAHQPRRSEIAKDFKSNFFKIDKEVQEQIGSPVKLVLILDEVDQIFPTSGSRGTNKAISTRENNGYASDKRPTRESSDSESDTVYHYYCQFAQALKTIIELPGRATTISLVVAMEYPSIQQIDRFPGKEQFQNPFYGRFRSKPVRFLSREDWDTMVQTIGDLVGLEYSPKSLDLLYYYSSGHPDITRKLGSCLIELRDINNRINDPITVEDIRLAINYFLENRTSYAYYLETTFWKDPLSTDLDAEQRVMLALAEEEEEFSESDLRSKLLDPYEQSSRSEDTDEGERLIRALYRLVDLQIVSKNKEKETYAISIPLYKEWIRREILFIEVES